MKNSELIICTIQLLKWNGPIFELNQQFELSYVIPVVNTVEKNEPISIKSALLVIPELECRFQSINRTKGTSVVLNDTVNTFQIQLRNLTHPHYRYIMLVKENCNIFKVSFLASLCNLKPLFRLGLALSVFRRTLLYSPCESHGMARSCHWVTFYNPRAYFLIIHS